MSEQEHHCPICGIALAYFARYPNYICGNCSKKTVDENGREICYANTTPMGGGIRCFYRDTGEERSNHICYISGVKCFAKEHRFGGIVIEPRTGAVDVIPIEESTSLLTKLRKQASEREPKSKQPQYQQHPEPVEKDQKDQGLEKSPKKPIQG